MVTVGASMFFAEISGSAVADVAALGTLLIPAMKSRGYPKEFAAACTSSAASLAIIIPPSIPMILYAAMAQESAVKLFVAGIIPGVLGGLGLMGLCYYYAWKYNFPVEQKFRLTKLAEALREGAWALIMPLIILGGIFGGYVTATEGAALAVLAALGIAVFIYRDIDLKALYQACIDSAIQTAVVMLLVAASALVGVFLTESQLPQKLAASIIGVTRDPSMVLLILNVFFLILGMFLHSAAAIILTVPIVLPLIQQVGIDPIHFGLVLTLNLAIGQQTPPVASVLIAACSIAKSDIWATTRANLGFIGVLLTVLVLCTYVPWLSLVLIRAFYGN
jgi:tripartite ATP-independent transporter DctM subunit